MYLKWLLSTDRYNREPKRLDLFTFAWSLKIKYSRPCQFSLKTFGIIQNLWHPESSKMSKIQNDKRFKTSSGWIGTGGCTVFWYFGRQIPSFWFPIDVRIKPYYHIFLLFSELLTIMVMATYHETSSETPWFVLDTLFPLQNVMKCSRYYHITFSRVFFFLFLPPKSVYLHKLSRVCNKILEVFRKQLRNWNMLLFAWK